MRSLEQLTENVLSIYARLVSAGLVEANDSRNYDILGELVDYVSALALTIFASDGELGDEEAALLSALSESVEGVGSGLPPDNHFRWAEATLQNSKRFLKLAAAYDRDENSNICQPVLWHIKNIIMTLVDADEKMESEEIEIGRILLSDAEELVAVHGVSSDTDIFDFPPKLVAAFTEERERSKSSDPHSEETIDDLLEELNRLAGLEGIKAEVATLVNLMKIRSLRQSRGLKMPEITLHMVFSGKPGTGKTTIGRLLGRIYKALGVLPKGHLVEVDRSALVAGYVGQTALKSKEALEKAHGGVLFIDEAYSLARGEENDFGQEAIDTILKYMEDNRDEIVVIAAGYENEMDQFVTSNPGLQSRFNKFLRFEDYSADQLYAIFLLLAQSHDYYYSNELAMVIHQHLEKIRETKGEKFANARDVRNAFESIVQEQANRIATHGEGEEEYALQTFVDSDVEEAFKSLSR